MQTQFLFDEYAQRQPKHKHQEIPTEWAAAYAKMKDVTGTVTNWNEERGFGFVTPDNGLPAFFVHRTELIGQSSALVLGDRVTLDTDLDPKSGKLKAVNVRGASGVGHKDTRDTKTRMTETENPAQALVEAMGIAPPVPKPKAAPDYSHLKEKMEWEYLKRKDPDAAPSSSAAPPIAEVVQAAGAGSFVAWDAPVASGSSPFVSWDAPVAAPAPAATGAEKGVKTAPVKKTKAKAKPKAAA